MGRQSYGSPMECMGYILQSKASHRTVNPRRWHADHRSKHAQEKNNTGCLRQLVLSVFFQVTAGEWTSPTPEDKASGEKNLDPIAQNLRTEAAPGGELNPRPLNCEGVRTKPWRLSVRPRGVWKPSETAPKRRTRPTCLGVDERRSEVGDG